MILHDIRNPLSILKGQLQLMQMSLADPEKLAGHVAASISEVNRLERLAGEFLDYSRGEVRLDMAVIRPSELFAKVEAASRRAPVEVGHCDREGAPLRRARHHRRRARIPRPAQRRRQRAQGDVVFGRRPHPEGADALLDRLHIARMSAEPD